MGVPASWARYRDHHAWKPDGDGYLLGINRPELRHDIATEYGYDDLAWVHSHAYLGPDCIYGAGTHINYGVTMTRTKIGHHCTITPGVTICGDVTIGDRVFIGAGAIIVNLTTVPDDTFIKAGTVWTAR